MKRAFSSIIIGATFVVSVAIAGPAQAETITKSDPDPECSQAAPLDVRRATFTYREGLFKVRMKMKALSKRRTQVFARYRVGTRYEDKWGVMLVTKYVDGERKAFGYWADYENGEFERFSQGVEAEWDWGRSTITFKLTSHLRGRKVSAAAYSVPKGADHGPPCGDSIYVRRLSRG